MNTNDQTSKSPRAEIYRNTAFWGGYSLNVHQFDKECEVKEVDGGAMVQCWVFVPDTCQKEGAA